MDNSAKEKHACEGKRYIRNGCCGWWHPCGKTARFCENGEWYCGIHAPSKVEVRKARSEARYERRTRVWNARCAVELAEREIIAAAMAKYRFEPSAVTGGLRDACTKLDAAQIALRDAEGGS